MLIVSEELKELTLLLDKYRSEHAIQLKTLTERRLRQQRKQETKLKTLKQDHVNCSLLVAVCRNVFLGDTGITVRDCRREWKRVAAGNAAA